jgi:hypothetical protein
MHGYLEEQHPLAAEKWREDFINWITHDDITFEQAASPWLRKVIINGQGGQQSNKHQTGR